MGFWWCLPWGARIAPFLAALSVDFSVQARLRIHHTAVSSVMLAVTTSAYSLLSPVSSQRCIDTASKRAAVDMKYNGGGPGLFRWQPAWKAALDAGDVMPASSPGSAAPAPAASAEGLSTSQWLGGATAVLFDATLTETVEERVAALLENGCPQSVVDSCLKNFDLVPAPAVAATPASEAAPAAAASAEGLSTSQWLGGATAVLFDATLTETVEERVAALLENGCPQSVVDSCLKNFDLVPAPAAVAAPEPVLEPVAAAVETPMKGVVKPTKAKAKAKPVKKSPKGIFAPAVLAAKAAMGEKELNALRAKVIAEHTKVISAFVDTSESRFGQIALRRLFDAADADGNGTLDKQEVRSALQALGFEWLEEKQVDQIVKRGDLNDDEVIDFEEFVKEAPRTLRVNLVKLAKQNGHDLGFLA